MAQPVGSSEINCCLSAVGARPNPGPPSPRAGGRGQEHQELVREGAQDQGHLPHAQSVQSGRDAEVSHRRVLGARARHGDHPARSEERHGELRHNNLLQQQTSTYSKKKKKVTGKNNSFCAVT